MPATVLTRQRVRGISIAGVRRDACRLLKLLGESPAELTVTLVDDTEMQRLNRTYRGADRPTDVLAFPMREGTRAPGDDRVLGDVVISLDTAARQAHRRRVPAATEVRTLLIHGVLHLLGYDHERSATEARRMQAMERRLRMDLQGLSRSRAERPSIRRQRRAATQGERC